MAKNILKDLVLIVFGLLLFGIGLLGYIYLKGAMTTPGAITAMVAGIGLVIWTIIAWLK